MNTTSTNFIQDFNYGTDKHYWKNSCFISL